MAKHYSERISGPVADRIDIYVEVQRVPFEKLSSQRTGEPSATVRKRVEVAQPIQRRRFEGTPPQINTFMGLGEIRQFCPVDHTSTNPLKAAIQQMQLSARAYHRIPKLARTVRG